ncbi:universal stress protein [Rhodobacteraceae bacterium HSP-20]|uniref:Universal stress protein n=1 Tax=Paragemmobacter amnigenus TaxID=2852097 RepID=A0ABS6IYK8_9RHOB|nr:universal stress protein [Rhodobacter amnigenus]MBU9696606.1 universal stress protein [Rhodobacter amnigenus]MBV4387833.1 universal stress protein [Rhodobacter amnigenus]
MALPTLATVLFDVAEAAWLVEKVAELALAFDSHVLALHPFSPVIWADGMGGEAVYFASMLEWEERESVKIRALVEEALRRNGLRGEYRGQSELYGAEPFLMGGARGADAVILGATADRSPDGRLLAQRMVRESGRPALVLGRQARLAAPARRIVVGWTDTREATRAAHDALALAGPGADITLVTFHARAGSVAQGLTGRDDLAAALDRAGFKVEVADQMSSGDELPEAIARFAKEREADLLATGAFGHTQLYDLLVGAVTRDLMDRAAVPVLLSR